MGGSPSLAK
jgi:hypothetical protein